MRRSMLAKVGTLARAAMIALVCAAVGSQAVLAEDLVSGDWQFKLTPFAWALALDGDVTVRGQKSSPSVSFSEIFDHLNSAVMLDGEARKGRLGGFANLLYANLGVSESGQRIRLKTTLDVIWLSFGAFYRLGPWNLGPEAGAAGPKVVVDPYVGGRYTYLDTEIRIRNGGPQVEGDQNWIEPMVGLRTIWELTPKWSVTALGDIGGFGAGSDFAWQATGLVGYTFGLFGENNARVNVGYRALHQDYDTGSGDDKFEWDMTLHGPVITFSIQF